MPIPIKIGAICCHTEISDHTPRVSVRFHRVDMPHNLTDCGVVIETIRQSKSLVSLRAGQDVYPAGRV